MRGERWEYGAVCAPMRAARSRIEHEEDAD
jgi:hypothetical protein